MKTIFTKFNKPLKAYMQWIIASIVFFALVNVLLYMTDIRSAIIFSVALVIYIIFVVTMNLANRKKLTNSLVEFASGYAHMQKQMLDSFEVPYALMDDNGKLIWSNEAFNELVGEDCTYKTISTIFPETAALTIFKGEMDKETVEVKFGDREYRFLTDKVQLDDGILFAIYLFDDTEINACRKELHDEAFVSGLLYIDNYEEVLENVEEVKRALLMALVDRKINQYFAAGNSVVRKLEKDKYLLTFNYKYLEELRESRFSILEDIKTVSIGNEMKVTLSIGIGTHNGSFQNCFDMARTAIDLALGRGGDQAVVREGDNVTYYGGKSNSIEKHTRVKARVKAHALKELLLGADNVLIMGHKISDVDAVGAAVGVFAAARMFDKKANIVLNEITTSMQPIVDLYNNSPDYDKDFFVKSEEALAKVSENTLLVVVDVNKRSYTECPELLEKCKRIVVLDHHRQGNEPVDNATLAYVEPYASSACEMVAEILQYIAENVKIKPIEADTLYAGILIDTTNFSNKAGARTFEAAAFIRRNGADIVRVRKLLRSDMTEYKAKAEAVRNAEVYKDVFAISVCPAAGLQSPTIVGAQAANELLDIAGIKASFVLTVHNGEIFISARSIDEVNVQLIMERLGGGGHMNIAGAQIKDEDMESAIRILKHTLDIMIVEGAI